MYQKTSMHEPKRMLYRLFSPFDRCFSLRCGKAGSKPPKLVVIAVFFNIFLAFAANSAFSDPTVILLYGGDPAAAQPGTVVPAGSLDLQGWGAGASEKANFPAYFGRDSLKIDTEGYYEGARIDLPEPIDLSQFIQDSTQAFLSLRLAQGKAKAPPPPPAEVTRPAGPTLPWGPFTGAQVGTPTQPVAPPATPTAPPSAPPPVAPAWPGATYPSAATQPWMGAQPGGPTARRGAGGGFLRRMTQEGGGFQGMPGAVAARRIQRNMEAGAAAAAAAPTSPGAVPGMMGGMMPGMMGGMMGGMGMMPGMMGGMMPGMMGGMAGAAPSAAGAGVSGEATGRPAIPTQGQPVPLKEEAAPPLPPAAVRVVLVTDKGELATGSLALAEGVPEARGWIRIDVPLSELKGSESARQGKVERVIVTGDRPGDFYLGQVAIVVEGEPLDFEVKLVLGPDGVAKVGEVLAGEVQLAAGVKPNQVRASWDFDDRDGVKGDLARQKVWFAYSEAGEYLVTVTVADIAGRRAWARKQISLMVEEEEVAAQ